MTTALALAALTVWIAPFAVIAALIYRDRHDVDTERQEPDAEWLAELAPERPALPQRRPSDCTPIYDALMCARIEKEEGWV